MNVRQIKGSFYYIAIRCSMVLTDRCIRSLGFCLQDWEVDAGLWSNVWKSFHKEFYRGCASFKLGLGSSVTRYPAFSAAEECDDSFIPRIRSLRQPVNRGQLLVHRMREVLNLVCSLVQILCIKRETKTSSNTRPELDVVC